MVLPLPRQRTLGEDNCYCQETKCLWYWTKCSLSPMVHCGFPSGVFTILPMYDKPWHSPATLRTSSALSCGQVKTVGSSVLCQWQDFTIMSRAVSWFRIQTILSTTEATERSPAAHLMFAQPRLLGVGGYHSFAGFFSAVAFTNHMEDCKSHPIIRLKTQACTVFSGMALFGVPTPRRLSGDSWKPQAVAEANEITERFLHL